MLLQSKPDDVQKLIDNMEKEVKGIKKHAIKLAWHMRGGATYDDILNMSVEERNAITNLIEENLETTKKTNLPYF